MGTFRCSPGRPTITSAVTRPSSPISLLCRPATHRLVSGAPVPGHPVDTRNGQFVSGNFFRTLGAQPWIGRLMTDADDEEGTSPVAVMSYRTWSDKYGSDPTIVGSSYQINGHLFTVIGVAPPGFYGAKLAGWGMPDIWIPVTSESLLGGAAARLKRPNSNWLDLLGRVRPGVSPKTLEAKLRVEFHDWLA